VVRASTIKLGTSRKSRPGGFPYTSPDGDQLPLVPQCGHRPSPSWLMLLSSVYLMSTFYDNYETNQQVPWSSGKCTPSADSLSLTLYSAQESFSETSEGVVVQDLLYPVELVEVCKMH